jgi:hypothetical protein
LVVYRTAPAKSFVGSADIRAWSRDGFEFVEAMIGGKLFRLMLVGDKEVRTEIPRLESAHELSWSMAHPGNEGDYIHGHFTVLENRIVERVTGHPLAVLSSVTIENGWFDRLLIRGLGFVADPHVCGKDSNGNVVADRGRIGIAEMVRKTLTH